MDRYDVGVREGWEGVSQKCSWVILYTVFLTKGHHIGSRWKDMHVKMLIIICKDEY